MAKKNKPRRPVYCKGCVYLTRLNLKLSIVDSCIFLVKELRSPRGDVTDYQGIEPIATANKKCNCDHKRTLISFKISALKRRISSFVAVKE